MIDPKSVHEVLGRHQLADGYPFVVDLEASRGVHLRDSVSGEDYLDCFTSFASWPIGYAHPMMEDEAFRRDLQLAALTNLANSDLYTTQMADFVEAFSTRVTPADYPYHFWVQGGALAVENTLKTAFDWKARKLGVEQAEDGKHLVILHFKGAFHGRSGYTMSLTNTDPNKVALFPKFDWPRVSTPAVEVDHDGRVCNDIEALEKQSLDEIDAAFECYAGRIAGIIIEPMQGEGGDNHFRPEFLAALRRIADEREALLIFDEVQTGFFGSGKPWMWQIHGVAPDLVAFGKKTQICGLYSNRRVDEVADNVFHKSTRINSTWGGNLVDMVRCKRFIDIIEAERLDENISARGCQFVAGLRQLAREKGHLHNVRGYGSLVAFTLESPAVRDAMLKAMMAKRLLALPSGQRAIRFRLPLVISEAEVDEVVARVAESLPAGATA
jgi:L-lysine 6-transaminase